MKVRNIAITLALFLCANVAFANSNGPDFLRSIGKIYVVVAVMVATFIGIVLFLVYLDRKIKKIESEISSHE